MKSTNPLLTRGPLAASSAAGSPAILTEATLTLRGVAGKAAVLLAVLLFGAAFTWHQAMLGHGDTVVRATLIGLVGGLACVLVASFVPTTARYTAPLYAVLEGLALGGLSAIMEQRYPGIAMQSAGITGVTAAVAFVGVSRGWIRLSARVQGGMLAALLGLVGFRLVALLMSWAFQIQVPGTNEFTPLGFAVGVVAALLAAAFLVLDFQQIREADGRAPRTMEWMAAMGLLVTLVWLYVEVLRLLAAVRRR